MSELSIIIPVYNRQASVTRALESALAQCIDDIEILIVDDGSWPSIELPAGYGDDPRIRLLRHSTNRGAAAARNTGMQNARGTWIAFLDSDDYWLPGTLAPRLAEARNANAGGANPLLVHVAGFELIRAHRGRIDRFIPLALADACDFASGCWFCPGSTALFLREPLLARVGGQDENLRRFEDVDWFLRIALAGGGITTNPVIAARIEVGPRPSIDVIEKNGSMILQKFASSMNSESSKSILRQLKAWFAFERASGHWHAGHYGRTLAHLLHSWWLQPRQRLYLRKFWRS